MFEEVVVRRAVVCFVRDMVFEPVQIELHLVARDFGAGDEKK
jgi:hypothetical protein